ncbi:cysteine--tRNA ligase [Gammaproteobacteria bacterium]|nr:cysteine--tRNA ligase [Gammaproteobacteria bacterium]
MVQIVQYLKIHNTLSRQKEEFKPLDSEHIKIYACGPTVYNYAHIGNARMAVVFDSLVRLLRFLYPKVTYVSNITDIDDKIIDAANKLNVHFMDITEKYADIYNQDMAKLGVHIPDVQPKATEYIPEMIDLINDLIDKDHAYEKEGHVLFHVLSYPNYGLLSNRNRDEQIAGSRVEIAPFKKDPADFVLWKPSSDTQPGWDSPWGFGRPGWHTECSAMSEKTLGLPFDIHGGGRDLTFPHHENEIAQSCCSSADIDNPNSYANYWMHNGFVTVNSEKMSKSLNNVLLVDDLIKNYDGEVLRLALLSSHYRQGLDWNEGILHQAKKLLDKMYRLLRELQDIEVSDDEIAKPPENILDALCDDLNTPKVLMELNSFLGDITSKDLEEKKITKINLLSSGNLLGLLQEDPNIWLKIGVSEDQVDAMQIEVLIESRNKAREDKNFALADSIRVELSALGIEIEDTADGTVWKSS